MTRTGKGIDSLLLDANVDEELALEEDVVQHQDVPTRTIPIDGENCAENIAQIEKQPVLLSPFIPGISEELKKIAGKYEVKCWYTFPGSSLDAFTQHRGRQHLSKASNCVYSTICSCGCRYVGESNRNLKVRMKEHTHPPHHSSTTAFTAHLRPNTRHQQTQRQTRQLTKLLNSQPDLQHSQTLDSATVHRPVWKDTLVLASERNSLKRIIIESICIQTKSAKLCNSGVSVEIPDVWDGCREAIGKELVCMD